MLTYFVKLEMDGSPFLSFSFEARKVSNPSISYPGYSGSGSEVYPTSGGVLALLKSP